MTRDIAMIGVGWLAVATLLARAGHRVTVLERFAEPKPLGSGLMLQPMGLATLGRLGLREEVAALGARIAAGGTDLLIAADMVVAHGRTARPLLARRCTACCGVPSPAPVPASRPRGRSRGSTRAAPAPPCATGPAPRSARRRSSSMPSVRDRPSALWSNRVPRAPLAYGTVWASVPDPGIAPGVLLQRHVAARVMLGWLPVGQAATGGPPLAALFWSIKPGDHAAWAAGFDAWLEEASALWPPVAPVLAGLSGPGAFTPASYVQFTAKRPWRGRLVLLGDAAHATSPQLGQGANSALLDALALADALAAETEPEAAFARYAAQRRRHVRLYQQASALITPFFQGDSRAMPMLRDAVFHRMRIVPWLRLDMVRTLAGLKTGLLTHRDAARLAGLL